MNVHYCLYYVQLIQFQTAHGTSHQLEFRLHVEKNKDNFEQYELSPTKYLFSHKKRTEKGKA